ncbi:MAG: hypothetical protein A2Y12_06700 [Planctomycetes bacterium GWF2_42_9]|nr:MAG: hypothetical protein A2Y12_06700 [Planctomycetes bacterium GWF2_42_9]HAL46108.1 hypothetical protein [Phycisphaerales bacterium]
MRKFIVLVFLSIFVINTTAFAFFSGGKKESRAVAATVNGAKIYEDTLVKIARHRAEETSRSNPEFDLAQARSVVLGEMIFTEIILQKGKEKNISIREQELKDEISQWERSPYDELKKDTNFKGDFAEIERSIKAQMIYRKLLLQEYVNELKPTEEQMRKFYEENIHFFQEKTKYHIKSIDIWPDQDCNDTNYADTQAKENAQKILERLKSGEDFNSIAEAEILKRETKALNKMGIDKPAETRADVNSHFEKLTAGMDPNDPRVKIAKKVHEMSLQRLDENPSLLSKHRKCDTMYVKAELNMNPELQKAVLLLKPGQMSEVLTLEGYGRKNNKNTYYSIIQFLEKIEGTTQSYEEVKDRLRQYVLNQLQENAFYDYGPKLIKEADIRFTNPADDYRLQDKKEVSEPNVKE